MLLIRESETLSYDELQRSLDGAYDIRIVTATGEPIFTASSTAKADAGLTALSVSLNSSLEAPDWYILQLRKGRSEWNSFLLLVR